MSHSVLVTGAFGKVGSGTVRHLLAGGHRVVAVDLQTPKTLALAGSFAGNVDVVWGDIRDPNLWSRVLPRVDTVVHLAAIIPPAADRNPQLTVAVNENATAELVRHMTDSPSAKRLIFASSMVVAGHEQHRRTPPLTAAEEPRPSDLYGRTKAAAEALIQASSLQWSILRITVCTTSELSSGEAVNVDLMFDGSADGRVEVVHHDDAALAFANAVSCDAAIGKILYVGGGEHCRSRVLDFYNGMLGAIGLGPLKAAVLRPGPPHFFGDWVDTVESQRLLAFQRHSLKDIYSELRANAGFKRHLLKVLAPLINSLIERRSPYRARS